MIYQTHGFGLGLNPAKRNYDGCSVHNIHHLQWTNALKKFAFLFGSQKCGTTWLSANLRKSAQVYDAGIKEWRLFRYYFNQHRQSNNTGAGRGPIKQIRHQMRLAPDEFLKQQAQIVHSDPKLSVLMDCTPALGVHLTIENFRYLKELFSGLQLETVGLLLMRDPVERAVSQLSMVIHAGQKTGMAWRQRWKIDQTDRFNSTMIDQLVDQELSWLTLWSRYDEILKKISALNVDIPSLVITTDCLFSSDGLNKVTQFLGIEKIEMTSSIINARQHVPIKTETKRKIAQSLEGTYAYMERYFGADGFPRSWWPSLELLK